MVLTVSVLLITVVATVVTVAVTVVATVVTVVVSGPDSGHGAVLPARRHPTTPLPGYPYTTTPADLPRAGRVHRDEQHP